MEIKEGRKERLNDILMTISNEIIFLNIVYNSSQLMAVSHTL